MKFIFNIILFLAFLISVRGQKSTKTIPEKYFQRTTWDLIPIYKTIKIVTSTVIPTLTSKVISTKAITSTKTISHAISIPTYINFETISKTITNSKTLPNNNEPEINFPRRTTWDLMPRKTLPTVTSTVIPTLTSKDSSTKAITSTKTISHAKSIPTYITFETNSKTITNAKTLPINNEPEINFPRRTTWDLMPIHKTLPTVTSTDIPTLTSQSIPKSITFETISNTSTTDVNTYPVTLNENLTTLMTTPSQKKVVKITKKVTSKVTKKITVKVTKKKDSPQ